MSGSLKFVGLAAIIGLFAALTVANANGPEYRFGEANVFDGPIQADNNRRERRDDRQDDRKDDRGGRQDCRDEEGLVGKDKRDCKQEERRDSDDA